jgi:hypothetical protein
MHTISVHNQCSNFGLGEFECFVNGANSTHCRRGNSVNTRDVDFIPFLSTFGGAVTYKLQDRNYKPNHRPGAARIRCLVAWKSEGYKKFYMLIHLIEYNRWVKWNEIKLDDYCQRYANQFSIYTGPIKSTWLMPNGIVLMIRLNLDSTQRDGIMSITISEGVGDGYTKRLVWLDSNT